MTNRVDDFDTWVKEYGDDLFSWAIYKTSNKDVAEDLVQDTFVAAFHGIAKFKSDSSPKTWLFSILKNKIADFHRQQFKENSISIDDYEKGEFFDEKGAWLDSKKPTAWNVSEDNLLDDRAFISVLQKCMDKLPQLWSSTLNFKYLENKKGKAICQDLGISETNYWQVLHRAKLQVRDCLNYNWFKI